MATFSATYSPEDNKLRLYSRTRLDAALYQRVTDAGFSYAPKQGLFVAPMWTPAREDLLIELCGEIGDEDTTLAERAEERADRFTDYKSKRASDAQVAQAAATSIAERRPFGQQIMRGHHSEARALRDQERIENGMRKAVQLWDASEYWERRAAGALQHAKYKERPDVRYRRIKGIEAAKRKAERTLTDMDAAVAVLSASDLTVERAKAFAALSPVIYGLWQKLTDQPCSFLDLCAQTLESLSRARVPYVRWIEHYANRITYERAMLGEQGGLAVEGVELKAGGRVLIDNEWLTIVRVNMKDGKPVSVSTDARFVRVRGIETIKEYRAPSDDQAATAKKAASRPPLVNYPGEGFAHMTKAAYQDVTDSYRSTRAIEASRVAAKHRVRTALAVFATPGEEDPNKRHRYVNVFLTDSKRVDPPAAAFQSDAPEAADMAEASS
ncbi:DUF3560 domain-containing protein [Burkholderia cepacia]|uniref:DUF3560 domain-containing protein n=1 Tax=Burkholderia cepacia TaxID=292 RepID=UPI00069F2C77|nr:DUF3560 domain-containing protein [Burkholderia cepacia]